jgi:pimeloyl-ACP methyl ester carboxylesterase
LELILQAFLKAIIMARQIFNRKVTVDGVEIFYREAGDRTNPSVLLLHGFPSLSAMFKNLMTALSDRFHLVAPDYPGFGFSEFPDKSKFEYTFKNIGKCMNRFTDKIKLESFFIYLHDYGCPIGLHICMDSPEKIKGIIVQNGNAYEEGLGSQWDEIRDYWKNPTEEKKEKVYAFLSKEGVYGQYTSGLPAERGDTVGPEMPMLEWELMQRPGNIDMQYVLNCDYPRNIDMFPAFQEYFRTQQPPALVIWGKYDPYFNVEEAACYKRDLHNVQTHIIDAAHMALETNFEEILGLMKDFLVDKGAGQ